MKFFIDTANLAEIREAAALGILDGVTTSLSQLAKEGIRGERFMYRHYETICSMIDGDIVAEVPSVEFDKIIGEGLKIAALHPNMVVKVPLTKDGLKAISWFNDNDIRTNCTLVFSAGQAMLAAKAGAAYVSPFIEGIDDCGWNGAALVEQIVRIYKLHAIQTEVLVASIRMPLHIIQCAEAGAHVCTSPPDAILGLLKHPLTDAGLERFMEDAGQMNAVTAPVLP